MSIAFHTASVMLLAKDVDGGLCAGQMAQVTHNSPAQPYLVATMSNSPLDTRIPTIAKGLGLPETTTMRGLLDMVNSPATSAARKSSIRGLLSHIGTGGSVEMFAAPSPPPLAALSGFERAVEADRRQRLGRTVCFSSALPASQIAVKLGLPADTSPSNLIRSLLGHDTRADEITWAEVNDALSLPRETSAGDTYRALKQRTAATEPICWATIAEILGLYPDATPEEILAEWKKRISADPGLVTLSAETPAVPEQPANTRTGLARATHAHHREVAARKR